MGVSNKISSRKKVAWFSAKPQGSGSQSKSAYTSAMLLPYLHQWYAIECFAAESSSEFDAKSDFKQGESWLPASRFESLARENHYDLLFYQLEDHPDCQFLRSIVVKHPGVVLFHDVLFREAGERIVADVGASKVSGAEHFCLAEVLNSRYSLFSNERNLSEYKRQMPRSEIAESGQDCSYFPYPVGRSESQELSDRSLASEPFVAFCGGPELEYRAETLLQVLSGRGVVLKWLIDQSQREATGRLIARYPEVRVEVQSERSPESWSKLVPGASAAVHLLFSAFGDPGPYLPISLSRGVPCVVSNFSGPALMSDSVVCKIAVGDTQVVELENFLATALSCDRDSEAYRYLNSSTLRDYVTEFHSAGALAEQLASIWSGLTCE